MSEPDHRQKEIFRALVSLENKWMNILTKTCRDIFSGVFLPSHDCSHHFRVWNFARQLVTTNNHPEWNPGIEDLEILLLACFFHDTGMSISTDARHGVFSRNICEDFLARHSFPPAGESTLLDIIEEHDRKEFYLARQPGKKELLLNLLHMADDLDAFGAIGVYRYTEIYLLRKIPIPNLAHAVLENLEKRFVRISNYLSDASPLFEQHHERYAYTRKFFESVAVETQKISSAPEAGGCGIFPETIARYVLDKKMMPEQLALGILKTPDSPLYSWAERFVREWNQTSMDRLM